MKKACFGALALVLTLVLAGCSADKLEEKINKAADKIEAGADALEDKLNNAADSIEEGFDKLEDKLNGVDHDTPTPEPTDAPAETPLADDSIRPEIKEAIDSYEEFFKEYVDFMASYDANDLSAMGSYLSFLQQYADTMQKLDDMDEQDLTDAENAYLTQAMLRIDQMLLDVATQK